MICNKTPISLMNEVCKANTVVPEYKVIEELGPPHEKSFKVELTLQNIGSYQGIDSTIKGAKHKAAKLGLETSGLTKPERKAKQVNNTPSVELNSLAAKLGMSVQYCDLAPSVDPYSGPSPIPSNAYGMSYKYTPGVLPYRRPHNTKMMVSLKVGDKEYFGEGFRKKEARRNAAIKALPDLQKKLETTVNDDKLISENPQKSEIPEPKVITVDEQPNAAYTKLIKSPISEVHEIASRRRMKIDFEVVSSTGPPHHRTFVTTVTVGEFSASGEGPSKKASKHIASSKVLEELGKLAPLAKSHANSRLYKHGGYSKSPKELDPSLNPISLLGQLRQRRKETLPVYTLVGEEGVRNKEFTIQVQVDSHTARGSGANKKEAKKNAAEAMLQLLGIRSPKPVNGGENSSEQTQKQPQGEEKGGEKDSTSEGRSLPPGLLPILPEMTNRATITPPVAPPSTKPVGNITPPIAPTVTVLNRAPGAPVGKPMSDEILQNGNTPAIQKLQKFAESGGFQVQYQNTTQENTEQYMAIVTITTMPPMICRGFGPTLEHAFEHAAANALISLLQPSVTTNGSVIDAAPGN